MESLARALKHKYQARAELFTQVVVAGGLGLANHREVTHQSLGAMLRRAATNYNSFLHTLPVNAPGRREPKASPGRNG